MRTALVEHDALIEFLAAQHGGAVVRPRGEGDSRFCVFARASDGVAAAAAIQRALHAEPWPAEAPLRVRMALHTGEADLRDGDYYGSAVNRCARLRARARGGQTLLSQAAYDLVRDALPAGLSLRDLRDLGEHPLDDLVRPERVYELVTPEPERGPLAAVALRVALAEDNYLVREGVRALLAAQPGVEVVTTCGDLDSLLEAVEREQPDVVLTDIRMPPTHTDEGIRAAAHLRAAHPQMGVVVLSQFDEPAYALALLEGGSAGRA